VRTLIAGGLIACIASNAPWALDTQICDPQRLCSLYRVCHSGQPVFPSDLAGSIGDAIGWRSQIYHTEKEPGPWSYCYFRALRLGRPGDRRPIRWQPAGITFFGTGEENGCAAVCELTDVRDKPGEEPIAGTIKAGLGVPIEADAPAWMPQSGGSGAKEPGRNLVPDGHGKRPIISRPHMIVSNGVTSEAPLGANLRVQAVSELMADGELGYWVTNLGRSNVRVVWNLPLNSSLEAADLAFANKGVLLAPGASYRRIADPASEPQDKGATAIERPSQILVEVAGRPILALDVWDLAPRNGDYETPPDEFLRRDVPR
jgi:hypothetical protein